MTGRFLSVAFAAALLAGCATVPDHPMTEGPVMAAGSQVALDQHVAAGPLVLTPKAVVEDSRCPMNAKCIWAGRLVVTTRIDGAGWRETEYLTLGKAYTTHGVEVTLVSGLPEKMAGQETPPSDYRFAYEVPD